MASGGAGTNGANVDLGFKHNWVGARINYHDTLGYKIKQNYYTAEVDFKAFGALLDLYPVDWFRVSGGMYKTDYAINITGSLAGKSVTIGSTHIILQVMTWLVENLDSKMRTHLMPELVLFLERTLFSQVILVLFMLEM